MKNTHIFFTSYPRKGQIHDEKIVGGASYTKTLLTYLKKSDPRLSIIVYAESFVKKYQEYVENGIVVKRIWKRNNLYSLVKSIVSLIQEQAQNIYFSYEINMVGGTVMNILFLLSLLFVKFSGKKLTFIPHQVVEDFSNLERSTLKSTILNAMKSVLFQYISLISEKIIVFEEYLRNVLPSPSKVVTVPLAVPAMSFPWKRESTGSPIPTSPGFVGRGKSGMTSFTMLFFGFLSPYKGLDELIDAYNPTMGKLIIAGGGNPNHMKNKTYRTYIEDIKEKALKKGITMTGFVPEKKIKTYYEVADVVLLPYRIFFSSSFPLSLAFSYEKPVLISKQLKNYFKSVDFQKALKASGLKEKDIVIDFKKDLTSAIKNIQKKNEQFVKFSQEIKKLRSIENIAKKFANVLSE